MSTSGAKSIGAREAGSALIPERSWVYRPCLYPCGIEDNGAHIPTYWHLWMLVIVLGNSPSPLASSKPIIF